MTPALSTAFLNIATIGAAAIILSVFITFALIIGGAGGLRKDEDDMSDAYDKEAGE